ncbi:type II toxin-antitoxin system RelE/ParE family toxin [Candidatus Pacearchaeota archaeon]|nr:type II toxin-antitoxin system RelE/ParE family toxin [Candidatus Pacearchaeota archaeon]
MYSIEIEQDAEKFLKKLLVRDYDLILKKIFSIRENPFHFLKKLQGSKLWRLRIKDYRAVIDVIVLGKRIIVLRIGHRKNVYG